MSQCLVCHESIAVVSWVSTILIKQENICYRCKRELHLIEGHVCEDCGRMGNFESRCTDCLRWGEHPYWSKYRVKNRSIYQYNEGMKMILNQFKFRGDYELYKAFEAEMRKVFIRDFTKIDLISFIPLSDERLYERGFNQAEVLAQLITSNAVPLLVKKEESKQSKKNRQERISTENPFILLPHIHLQDNHILLIDDIYTTGTTIRHAAQLLLQEGAKQVSSLTLIRS